MSSDDDKPRERRLLLRVTAQGRSKAEIRSSSATRRTRGCFSIRGCSPGDSYEFSPIITETGPLSAPQRDFCFRAQLHGRRRSGLGGHAARYGLTPVDAVQ